MKLTSEQLELPEAVLALGAVAVSHLRADRQVTFFINDNQEVEVCNPIEVALDALSEEQAILHLLNQRGYNDERLVNYLKGREARKKG